MTPDTQALVRLALLDDVAQLPEIERSAADAFLDSPHAWVAEHDVTPAEAYPPHVEAGTVWVAQDAGAVIGFCLAEAVEDALHVWELAVRHERQGRGHGRRLMQAAIDAALARGLPAVTLTTFQDVPWNAPFYRSLGFESLEADEVGDRLTALLAAEARRGLERRCAMRLALGGA